MTWLLLLPTIGKTMLSPRPMAAVNIRSWEMSDDSLWTVPAARPRSCSGRSFFTSSLSISIPLICFTSWFERVDFPAAGGPVTM